MSTSSPNGSSTSLIHEGWNHLTSQRPLAAWGSWQRALRVDPDSVAARQALTALESAADLPVAARTAYRFREPADSAKRAIWDDRMRGQSDQDLHATADLFGRLAAADPTDSAAWYNRGLCLAWMGKNLEAIGCLDRVVSLEAEQAFDLAVDAWTMAEVLRQGEAPRRWPMTCGSLARWPGRRAIRGGCLKSFPKFSACPRRVHPVRRRKTPRKSRCSTGSIGPLQTFLNPRTTTTCHERFWRAFISRAERCGCRVRGPRTWNESKRPCSRGSRRGPRPFAVKRRHCPCRSSMPTSGFFGFRRASIPIGPTSSAERRSNSISRTTGFIARATGWTADRR